jgi:hypothetical protein
MSMLIGTRRFANAFVGTELLEPGPLAVVENPYPEIRIVETYSVCRCTAE